MRLPKPRLSAGSQLALLAAVYLIPIVTILFLLIQKSWNDIAFTEKELSGSSYVATIWPQLNAVAAGEDSDEQVKLVPAIKSARAFNSEPALERYLASADPDQKLENGDLLVASVADGSNLTLDVTLDSFYVMDAVTTKIPAVSRAAFDFVAAVKAGGSPDSRTARVSAAMEDLRLATQGVQASLDAAARGDATGHVRTAIEEQENTLQNAVNRYILLNQDPDAARRSPAEAQQAHLKLQSEINKTWRTADPELNWLLQKKIRAYKTALWEKLALAALFVGTSICLTFAVAVLVDRRINSLIAAMEAFPVPTLDAFGSRLGAEPERANADSQLEFSL